MAVLAGGSQGARVAWNQADDCAADRLLALRAQIGSLEALVPDRGTLLSAKIGSEIAELDVGVNVFADGVTYGTNQLTSASNPFTRAMVGLTITIFGHGQRVIEVFNGPGDIEFSNPPIAAASGVLFTQPLGIAGFDDGEIVDGNTLKSVSAPFYAELVGRRVSIHGAGSREVTSFISTSEITFDGPAVADQHGAHFTMPVVMEQADLHLATGGGQVVDSHRLPALTQATVVRWRIGERRKRERQRVVYVP